MMLVDQLADQLICELIYHHLPSFNIIDHHLLVPSLPFTIIYHRLLLSTIVDHHLQSLTVGHHFKTSTLLAIIFDHRYYL